MTACGIQLVNSQQCNMIATKIEPKYTENLVWSNNIHSLFLRIAISNKSKYIWEPKSELYRYWLECNAKPKYILGVPNIEVKNNRIAETYDMKRFFDINYSAPEDMIKILHNTDTYTNNVNFIQNYNASCVPSNIQEFYMKPIPSSNISNIEKGSSVIKLNKNVTYNPHGVIAKQKEYNKTQIQKYRKKLDKKSSKKISNIGDGHRTTNNTDQNEWL